MASATYREYELFWQWYEPLAGSPSAGDRSSDLPDPHPRPRPQATVLFFPGHGDCAEASALILEPLRRAGIAVCAVDIPGQGRSSGKRGDLPSLALLDELTSYFYQEIQRRHPTLPVGIAGHSMGGHFALRALFHEEGRFAFCWVNAPLIAPERRKSKLEIVLLKGLARIVPTFTISTGVRRADCERQETRNATDREKEDAVARSRCAADSLFHNQITLRMGLALLQSCNELRAALSRRIFSLPLLVTQGTADGVTPPEVAEQFLSELQAPQLSYEEIEEGLHEAFRGETAPQLQSTVVKWLRTLPLQPPLPPPSSSLN